ncbi:MAG: hypothetical protein JW807_00955, partial [Spirochaetes bacterium]|nr:hypothetical protein [Spirochaetota bacterium]
MPFNREKTRQWKDGNTPETGTPALGSNFDDEYNQLYENCIFLKELTETLLSTDQTLEYPGSYKASGIINISLPSSPSEGQRIEIFTEDRIKILQSDAEQAISYFNKFWTTKGSSGHLVMPPMSRLLMTYKGIGYSRIEPGVKLSDPSTLPAGSGRTATYSPCGTYLAESHDDSPYITIYKRSGDTFTKLPDPSTLPAGNGNGVAFSPDGKYLAVAHVSSPYIT